MPSLPTPETVVPGVLPPRVGTAHAAGTPAGQIVVVRRIIAITVKGVCRTAPARIDRRAGADTLPTTVTDITARATLHGLSRTFVSGGTGRIVHLARIGAGIVVATGADLGAAHRLKTWIAHAAILLAAIARRIVTGTGQISIVRRPTGIRIKGIAVTAFLPRPLYRGMRAVDTRQVATLANLFAGTIVASFV